jgi:transcriptional regulator with XRE-family HTH domain
MRELYARSGVAISLISRVEHGQGTSVSTAAKLAAGLNVPLSQLLEPEPDPVIKQVFSTIFSDREVRAS